MTNEGSEYTSMGTAGKTEKSEARRTLVRRSGLPTSEEISSTAEKLSIEMYMNDPKIKL
jgi:hypothetical protein